MNTKKRIYIGLLAASLLLILSIVAVIYYLIANRDIIISQVLLISITVMATILFLILAFGIIAIVIIIIRAQAIPSLETISQRANELLFPLALFTGRLVGISKDRILQSYIAVNNYLVHSKYLRLRGEQIMILLPHCLQDSECPHKITMDVNNCKGCGKCDIAKLKEMAEEYNAIIKVATGGTLARKFVLDTHPRGVVAVACERDLSLGIHELGGLPVIGVLNCRPNGPCFNTTVNLDEVEAALQSIIKEDENRA
ncbi:MAG: DUF116 domain-containing protein [Syntrophomonadaceae bacterium]|nr:DUF116 domain-containing protein [Syntrophomonadaceae bacterium]MDD3897708.1 DUF116 domain-containing protein [Syntrophomonadaceae bacterium]MDD4561549.1 DUF116 domain-containing protein [Syntrophomonadaceae bacterium]